jgi:hypothetical protein
VQVRQFVGKPCGIPVFATHRHLVELFRQVLQHYGSKGSSMQPESSLLDWSSLSQIGSMAHLLCSDIAGTLSSAALRRLVNAGRSERLLEFFCFAVRLNMHISANPETGIYAKSAKAKIYSTSFALLGSQK